jgi:hypothetical protein
MAFEFKGLKHFPKGNGVLKLANNNLSVSGLSSSFDGLSIETKGASEWELTINPHTIKSGDIFGATFNLLDGLQRVKSVAQWAISYSPDGKYAYLVVNSRLEGAEIELQAFRNGQEVFRKVYVKPAEDECNWIIIAIFVLAAASVVLSNIDYKSEKKVITHPNGTRTTEVTTTKSIGGGGVINPVASVVATNPPLLDTPIEVDHLYITSKRCFAGELPQELDGTISEVILTAKTLDTVTIINETYTTS